jgi:hypothetical protein
MNQNPFSFIYMHHAHRYACTWNGTVFRISLDPTLSLATSIAGVLYTQPDVYPLTASPIDSLGAQRQCHLRQCKSVTFGAGLLHAAVFPLLDDPCMHVMTFNTSSGAASQVLRHLRQRCCCASSHLTFVLVPVPQRFLQHRRQSTPRNAHGCVSARSRAGLKRQHRWYHLHQFSTDLQS